MSVPAISETPLALQERIVEQARQMFLEHGYSKVSTSEIATALGISKKTIYREFETKEDILRAVIILKLKESAKRVDAILAKRLPFPEKLEAVLEVISEQQRRVSPVLLRDVYTSAPDIWKEIVEHKLSRIKRFEAMISEGMEKGYFRSDIPKEIIVRMHAAAIESLTTPQALGELPCTSEEVFQNVIRVLFEGIVLEGKRKSFAKMKPFRDRATTQSQPAKKR
jgi:AcrR family transcriptional regulator